MSFDQIEDELFRMTYSPDERCYQIVEGLVSMINSNFRALERWYETFDEILDIEDKDSVYYSCGCAVKDSPDCRHRELTLRRVMSGALWGGLENTVKLFQYYDEKCGEIDLTDWYRLMVRLENDADGVWEDMNRLAARLGTNM